MLPYFPLESDEYAMTMGTRAVPVDTLIEVDPALYRDELALKDEILASDYRYHFQAPPATDALQWETIELLLPVMARQHPQHFALATDGARWTWTNHLLGTQTAFTLGDAATLPLPPLDWVGRQVQEDLILMAEDGAAGTPLIAGHLCFAAGWCLDDMMGRSFLAIHGRVPLFADRIGRSADLLMQRIKPGHPSGRVNWSLSTDPELDHSPRRYSKWRQVAAGSITAENAGERCYLRLERQTLSRLPRTRAVLFTIHTYRAPIGAVIAEDAPHRARRLAAVLRTMPPEMRQYKGMTPYIDHLLAYLDAQVAAPVAG